MLSVTLDSTIKGTLNVGDVKACLQLKIKCWWTLDVTGDTSVSTFDSSGATSLATTSGDVNIASSGAMSTIKGTLNVDEAVTLDSTLDVTGDTSINGTLNMNSTNKIINLIHMSVNKLYVNRFRC